MVSRTREGAATAAAPVAHERLDSVRAIVDLAITLAWVLGGINLLYGALVPLIPGPLVLGVAFLLAFSGVGALLSLPFDIYETFALEQKFGFNRTETARALGISRRALLYKLQRLREQGCEVDPRPGDKT